MNNQINNEIKVTRTKLLLLKRHVRSIEPAGDAPSTSLTCYHLFHKSFFSISLLIFLTCFNFFFKAEVCTYTKHVCRTRFIFLFLFFNFFNRFLLLFLSPPFPFLNTIKTKIIIKKKLNYNNRICLM